MITALIDKQDGFEIVRDQIAAILTLEVANQMTLATAAGKDPTLWKLRVFSERFRPWETFNAPEDDRSPVVNVWYEDSNPDEGASTISERQTVVGVFNIDCYGYEVSSDNAGGGHNPGDLEAAHSVHRCLRLVRNILMSSEYTYLDLRGFVGQRWPTSSSVFQPTDGQTAIQNVIAARLSFRVRFNEFSPQYEFETLDLLSVDVLRTEDGQIVIEADYDYT